MFKKIPGNSNYRINLEKDIIDIDGNIVPKVDKLCFTLTLFGKKRTVGLNWLMLMAWYEYDILDNPELLFDNLEFTKIDSNVLRIRSEHIPYFKEPIYYKPGFRIVPSHPRYAINVDGIIIDTKENTYVTTEVTNHGYVTAYIYCPNKCGNRYAVVHRLLMLAWIPNSDYMARSFINHIDGNRSNNKLTNLEWCSMVENMQHAIDAGLITNIIRMKSRDIYTGEIRIHRSLADLCREIGVGNTGIAGIQTKLPGYLYKKRYELKQLDDDTPWVYEELLNSPDELGAAKAIYTFEILDKETGNVVKFHNTRKFTREYKLHCNNLEEAVELFKKRYPNLLLKVTRNAVGAPYRVLDLESNVIVVFDSIWRAAEYIGRNRNELAYDFARDRKHIYGKRWIVSFNGRDINIDDYTHKPERHQALIAIPDDGGEPVKYSAIKVAARAIGTTNTSITKYLDTDISFKGYKYRSVDE